MVVVCVCGGGGEIPLLTRDGTGRAGTDRAGSGGGMLARGCGAMLRAEPITSVAALLERLRGNVARKRALFEPLPLLRRRRPLP